MGFVAGIALLAVFANVMRSARLPRPLLRAMMLGGATIFIGITVAILLYPEIPDRWESRAFDAGRNVTFWMRVAAVVGQFQALTENARNLFFGQGFGASYPWPVSEFPWIVPFLGEGAGEPVWFPGEFMWMPFLYYGGFICGPIVAIALLAGVAQSYRTIQFLLSTQSWRFPRARPLWVGVLGYLAFLGAGFTANPFISRLPALFMGLCLGLVVAQSITVSLPGAPRHTTVRR